MNAPWPRTRVVRVIGILSSSTHTYSGSLATSPNRGFLIKSHRVSAALMVTEGSPGDWTPRICFAVEQPEAASATTTPATTRHCPFMTRSYHTRPLPRKPSVFAGRLPGEPLLLRRRRRQEGLAAREHGRPGDRGDPRHVDVHDAAPLDQDRHDPAGDVESLRDRHGPLRKRQDRLDVLTAADEEVVDREGVADLKALGLLEHHRHQVRNTPQIRP